MKFIGIEKLKNTISFTKTVATSFSKFVESLYTLVVATTQGKYVWEYIIEYRNC